jgi:Ca2+-binding EF-hand superfamily protein
MVSESCSIVHFGNLFVRTDKDESNTLDKVEFMSMMRHTHVNSRMEDATLLALARKIVNEIFERVNSPAELERP